MAKTSSPQKPPDNPEQSKRFIDMAREIGVDESPEAFDRALDRVVRPKPADRLTTPKAAARKAE
jgi:hypothetical protein